MYRKLTVVTIIVLLLSLAFASVSFAQSGTDNQGQGNQGTGPNNAFTGAGQGRSLAPGQRQWYSFQTTGRRGQPSADPLGRSGRPVQRLVAAGPGERGRQLRQRCDP